MRHNEKSLSAEGSLQVFVWCFVRGVIRVYTILSLLQVTFVMFCRGSGRDETSCITNRFHCKVCNTQRHYDTGHCKTSPQRLFHNRRE